MMAAGDAMINAARDRWLSSSSCPVLELVAGIKKRGMMRDAQLEAIKTYLFLKAGCGNLPLWKLYADGAFNSLSREDVYRLSLTGGLRDAMESSPGVAAMYEYLSAAELDAKVMLDDLSENPAMITPQRFFKGLLYGVNYTDYLFSLPMGAGKTYLIAAFIYLDLYFCLTDPENTSFARNFVVFAPSGLKSSVVPSLRAIQKFDPEWLFDASVANNLRSMVSFEVLDERKSAKGSNRVKNPNVQKIAVHQPYETCTGLVLVTNAEKVILDRVEPSYSGDLVLGADPDEKTRVANELRRELGKLPGLAVMIDEVHHAQSDDIKLRAVVNDWVATGADVNCVLGFSGTPFLSKKKKVDVAGGAGFKTGLIANTVYYYPLANGIRNFLKRPAVDIVSGDSDDIIRTGVNEFLDRYGDLTYANGASAKLAVFCSSVSRLEEEVYPLVVQILTDRGLDAARLVLKYHRGGASEDKTKRFLVSDAWEREFAALDTPLSEKRIVLLVQIGKEGWDCKSLTGVVLSQEGDCKKNAVLQTSCRCLREVDDAASETALIVVNRGNAKHLEAQLRETQQIDLTTFQAGRPKEQVVRHSRLAVLDAPPLEYRRFELSHKTVETAPAACKVEEGIDAAIEKSRVSIDVERVRDLDFGGVRRRSSAQADVECFPVTFSRWLRDLQREGGCAPAALAAYAASSQGRDRLRGVYSLVTEPCAFATGEGECRAYRCDFDQPALRSRIRALFYGRRDVRVDLEDAGETAYAQLVDESKLVPLFGVSRDGFYPDEDCEQKILASDAGDMSEEVKKVVNQLTSLGQIEAAEKYALSLGCPQEAVNTYQYIPYRFDSSFERLFYEYVMGLDLLDRLGLEVYYNGERSVADFRIDCFEKRKDSWRRVGKYTPDFLVIQRKGGSIGKTLMVETKGAGFRDEEAFAARRAFVEGVFLPRNEDVFHDRRFCYTVISDDVPQERMKSDFEQLLEEYFGEEGLRGGQDAGRDAYNGKARQPCSSRCK